jgi:hypothetical protein
VSIPGRHIQTANVENVNRILSDLLNGYMNAKENKTGIVSREWVPALKEILPDLNAYKKARNDKLVREQKSKFNFSRTNAGNYFDIGNDDTDQVEIVSDLKLKIPKF